jgi:hypothetical protein
MGIKGERLLKLGIGDMPSNIYNRMLEMKGSEMHILTELKPIARIFLLIS